MTAVTVGYLIGKLMRRWDNDIKVDPKEIVSEGVGYINLA
jgi:hypothetical protein